MKNIVGKYPSCTDTLFFLIVLNCSFSKLSSLSNGQYISMEYRKDGSVNTGSDFVGIEIYKYVDGSSESWSFGSQTSGGYGGYS